jgi:hypothetical protein
MMTRSFRCFVWQLIECFFSERMRCCALAYFYPNARTEHSSLLNNECSAQGEMLQAFGLQHGWSNMPLRGMLLYNALLSADPEKEKGMSRG